MKSVTSDFYSAKCLSEAKPCLMNDTDKLDLSTELPHTLVEKLWTHLQFSEVSQVQSMSFTYLLLHMLFLSEEDHLK